MKTQFQQWFWVFRELLDLTRFKICCELHLCKKACLSTYSCFIWFCRGLQWSLFSLYLWQKYGKDETTFSTALPVVGTIESLNISSVFSLYQYLCSSGVPSNSICVPQVFLRCSLCQPSVKYENGAHDNKSCHPNFCRSFGLIWQPYSRW
jgi:hypothetical protein